ITSAPRSPNIWVAHGPGSIRLKSTTRTPSSMRDPPDALKCPDEMLINPLCPPLDNPYPNYPTHLGVNCFDPQTYNQCIADASHSTAPTLPIMPTFNNSAA